MSGISSRIDVGNARSYLERFKIKDTSFPAGICYTFLTCLEESKNRSFSLLSEIFKCLKW